MVFEIELFEYANTKPLRIATKKIENTVIYIFILLQCWSDKILTRKWQIFHSSQPKFQNPTNNTPSSHTNRKVH